MLGSAQVVRADSRSLPLADASVDLIISSPPYWSLRSYQDNGSHYDGQIGAEASADEFLDALLDVMRECVRVLKPTGSIFYNLGDKYGPNKSLALIPERFRIRCTDELGLIARAVIVWSKPNGLPESVTDRVRRSHEDWMHFTLEPRYFSAVDEIREGYSDRTIRTYPTRSGDPNTTTHGTGASSLRLADNPLGKLPGSVWTVPTEPLRVPDHLGIDHFAAFPTEFPRRIIQGWSPAGVCVECGEGRRPVVDKGASFPRDEIGAHRNGKITAERGDGASTNNVNGQEYNAWRAANPHRLNGYVCACDPTRCRSCKHTTASCVPGRYHCCDSCTHGTPADTRPAVVLDPFGGTGTTAMVAKALGRHGITVDMSADYCRLAEWRTNDRNQLAKVLGVAKTETPDVDQLDLFGEATA